MKLTKAETARLEAIAARAADCAAKGRPAHASAYEVADVAEAVRDLCNTLLGKEESADSEVDPTEDDEGQSTEGNQPENSPGEGEAPEG